MLSVIIAVNELRLLLTKLCDQYLATWTDSLPPVQKLPSSLRTFSVTDIEFQWDNDLRPRGQVLI